MIPAQVADYVAQGLALFTSQFSADQAPQLRAWTASYLAQANDLEEAIWTVITERQLANVLICSPPPGTFSVQNGSPTVVCSVNQTPTMFPGNVVTFASQPGVPYVVSFVVPPTEFTPAAIELTTNYTGTTAAGTTATSSQTNAVLDVIGAIVGQPRFGQSDANYLALIYLRVAVNRSNATQTSWSRLAAILLQTSGGPVFYFESGTGGTGKSSAFYLGVWDMTLNPPIVASILALADPCGEGPNCFAWSVWPDGNDFALSSVYSDSSAGDFTDVLGIPQAMGGNIVPGLLGTSSQGSGGEGGFGSAYDGGVSGGLQVAASQI